MDQLLFGNQEGFMGVASREDVDALNKALTAGYGYSGAPSSMAGGAPIMVESLDASLKSTTFTLKNLVLWPIIPKDKAFNTVEQYTRILAYGGNGSPYFNEGGSPREEDPVYVRAMQNIRYVGTRRRVSHPMMLVRVMGGIGDVIANEINNGNMYILQQLERELYWGNAFYSNAGSFDGSAGSIPSDSLAMNGIDQQIRSGNTDVLAKAYAFTGFGGNDSVTVDMADGILTPDAIEIGAVTILRNFGIPTEMHMDPLSHSQLSRSYYIKERIMPMGVANGVAGFVLSSFVSSAGTFKLASNVFLTPKQEYKENPDNSLCPATPVAPVLALGGVNAGTTFAIGEVYRYRVAAIGDQGESSASPSAAAGAIAVDGESISVTITNVTGAKYYAVYRSNAAGAAGSERFIGFVKRAIGASTVLLDLNKKLPGRATSYLMFLDQSNLVYKQLAPLLKINLATVATSFEWLQVLYGCMIMPTPRKNYIFDNIGRA